MKFISDILCISECDHSLTPVIHIVNGDFSINAHLNQPGC